MSSIADAIQDKCLSFGDRIIKLNDYLLEQASRKYEGRVQKSEGKHQTSFHPSSFSHQPSRVPVHLQAIATLCNQLLRAATSIGAKTRTCSLIPVGS